MALPEFGVAAAQELGPVKALMGAMTGLSKKSLDSYESQIILRGLYDKLYGIADHDSFGDNRPMSLVALYPKETVSPYSTLARNLRRFAALRIGELFNMSATDFFNQPRDICEMMFSIAEDKTLMEERETNQINQQMAKAMRGE